MKTIVKELRRYRLDISEWECRRSGGTMTALNQHGNENRLGTGFFEPKESYQELT
jgi:hypothetical protein